MHDRVNIYTDGSSSYNKGKVGSGAVLVSTDKKIISEISKSVDKPGYKQAIVYIDYIGLIHWYEGTWSARNILSQTYIKMIREYQKVIDINFVKVKAHTGDEWNEYADNLAKKSIGI